MNNKNVKGIIALVVVTALSFGVILGSKALSTDNGQNTDKEQAKVVAELDVNGAEGVDKAVKTEDGYMVTVRAAGYVEDIVMNVSFAEDAQTITGVEVVEQNETPDLGAKVEEPEFLSQFEGVLAPVYLPGMTIENNENNTASDAAADNAEGAALVDGTYEAKGEPDSKGYYDVMTMTVEGGKITSVVWDCLDAEGNKKSVMSENGQYVMTEDGPTWKAQAEALAAALVNEQDLAFFTMDDKGKTDAVSGVSIAIGGFVNMAQDCLDAASGKKAPALVDGTYEAKGEPDSKGYYDVMTMTVEGGKITSVVWDCLDAEGNKKSVMSENGQYVMTEDGPTWKAQAEALAAALVNEQDLAFFTMDDKGKTDAVSGVSIAIGGFVNMAEQCLTQAAPASEKTVVLKDGTYEAKGEPDSKGYYDVMTMTVEGGKITSVVWDCLDAEGNKKSVMSENGQYVMTEDGPTWKAQAEALAAALVNEQDLAFFTMDDKGKTDAVSGVSIAIGGFVNMAEQCLTQAAPASEKTVVLKDGTYEAKGEPDSKGYYDVMTMTVEGGKITSVVWDCLDAEGNKKSVMSENGQYVMTEDGPTWKAQAEALAAALVNEQDLAFFTMDDKGKTDAVSGVSIAIGGFVNMAEQCLAQAGEEVADEAVEEPATEEAPQNGTLVDGISGATFSSKAAINGINIAYNFLQTVK